MKNFKPSPFKAVCEGNYLVITFPYNPDLVAKVKTLNERRWNSDKKRWIAPICLESVEKLREWGFDLDYSILAWADKLQAPPSLNIKSIPGLRKALFPYQLEGVQFIESRGGRALVADEMGLGKTAQALSWLQLHPKARPAIIVVPASLKLNWEREAAIWMSNPKVQILNGKPKSIRPKLGKDIVIINYDILGNDYTKSKVVDGKKTKPVEIEWTGWVDFLIGIRPQVIVTDECHFFKSNDAQRTKAVRKLAKGVPHFIALSGTPATNKPAEMYNAISCVEPKLFPSFWKFGQRYCGAKNNGFGWEFNGATNTAELHQKLTSTIMIRRLKADVLKDLPPKMRNVVPMQIENDDTYRRAEDDFIAWVREEFGRKKAAKAKQAEALTRLEGLKQLAVQGKLADCLEWIDNFLETGEKLVVFAVHKFVIDALMARFGREAVKVDGSVKNEDRQTAVDAFQNDESVRLFVGNIQAAGVGLTLTRASNTCFLELPWTPAAVSQAEDRVHRIGQESESVNAWYLLAHGTIEEELAALIDRKLQVLSHLLDGKEVDEESMISELLAKYTKED